MSRDSGDTSGPTRVSVRRLGPRPSAGVSSCVAPVPAIGNGYRLRLWKLELQKLADETGLEIGVCHFPPGTSKWNKVEHRLFSAITQNWRGRPLVSHEAIVELIGATTTRTGHNIRSQLDTDDYPAGVKVRDADMQKLHLRRDDLHGDWNYTLIPRLTLPEESVIA